MKNTVLKLLVSMLLLSCNDISDLNNVNIMNRTFALKKKELLKPMVSITNGNLSYARRVNTAVMRAICNLNNPMDNAAALDIISSSFGQHPTNHGMQIPWTWNRYMTYDEYLTALELLWDTYIPLSPNANFRDVRLASPYFYLLMVDAYAAVDDAGYLPFYTSPASPPFTTIRKVTFSSSNLYKPTFNLEVHSPLELFFKMYSSNASVTWYIPTNNTTGFVTVNHPSVPMAEAFSPANLNIYLKFIIKKTKDNPRYFFSTGVTGQLQAIQMSNLQFVSVLAKAINYNFESIGQASGTGYGYWLFSEPFDIKQFVDPALYDSSFAVNSASLALKKAAWITQTPGVNWALYGCINDHCRFTFMFDKAQASSDRTMSSVLGMILSVSFDIPYLTGYYGQNTNPDYSVVTLLNETTAARFLMGDWLTIYGIAMMDNENTLVTFHGIIPKIQNFPSRYNVIKPLATVYTISNDKQFWLGDITGGMIEDVPYMTFDATFGAFVKGRTTTVGMRSRLTPLSIYPDDLFSEPRE